MGMKRPNIMRVNSNPYRNLPAPPKPNLDSINKNATSYPSEINNKLNENFCINQNFENQEISMDIYSNNNNKFQVIKSPKNLNRSRENQRDSLTNIPNSTNYKRN